jgi:hypothetical protein
MGLLHHFRGKVSLLNEIICALVRKQREVQRVGFLRCDRHKVRAILLTSNLFSCLHLELYLVPSFPAQIFCEYVM